MQARLARHFLPAEAVVLGHRLQPFTLWHWRTLAALGSPLVGDGEMEFADLLFAVRLCALPPFSPLPKMRGWWLRFCARIIERRCDLLGELATFLQYLAHYKSGPLSIEGEFGSPRVKLHPALYLASALLSMGMSEREAWSVTPGLARWYLCGAADHEGRELLIVTDRQIEDALAAGYTEEDMGLG